MTEEFNKALENMPDDKLDKLINMVESGYGPETDDKTLDNCKKCGKEIKYDREDGYWDNLDGNLWTPFNCLIENDHHEPINHVCDKKGFYHQI